MYNLMFGVQLANISTRCSGHTQGKREARCDNVNLMLYRCGSCTCIPGKVLFNSSALICLHFGNSMFWQTKFPFCRSACQGGTDVSHSLLEVTNFYARLHVQRWCLVLIVSNQVFFINFRRGEDQSIGML